jgi:aspartate aminotransferase
LCERLLSDTGVAILPGSAFGSLEENYKARLAFVNFDGNKTLKASRKIINKDNARELFLKKYCGETLHAIDLICGWVKNL